MVSDSSVQRLNYKATWPLSTVIVHCQQSGRNQSIIVNKLLSIHTTASIKLVYNKDQMMQLNANSHSLLLFQADCFVPGLTLRSNTVVENLCMHPNIGPAAVGPAGPVATALFMATF